MKRVAATLAVTILVSLMTIASDIKLEGVKCIVGGEQASASISADYQGGKVFFCCPNCQAKFKGDPAKYTAKANHQLVATGQVKQSLCPISGEKINPEKSLEIQGAKVFFCCDDCKNQVAKANDDEQLGMVFGAAAWQKAGFKVN
jgi:YHS domain-containing protein